MDSYDQEFPNLPTLLTFGRMEAEMAVGPILLIVGSKITFGDKDVPLSIEH